MPHGPVFGEQVAFALYRQRFSGSHVPGTSAASENQCDNAASDIRHKSFASWDRNRYRLRREWPSSSVSETTEPISSLQSGMVLQRRYAALASKTRPQRVDPQSRNFFVGSHKIEYCRLWFRDQLFDYSQSML